MLTRRAGTAAVLTTATTVLTACASTGGFSDLDRDPQPNDPLPEVAPDEEGWVAGCSDRGPVNVGGPADIFTVVPDGAEPPDSATRVSENVFAR